MKEAGLTHGGFYGHFKSKGHLVEEACSRAVEHSWARWTKIADDAGSDAFVVLVKNYLAQKHLSSSGSGCLFAAVGGDASRHRKPVRRVFTDGFEKLIGILAKAAPEKTKAEKRKRAIAASRRWSVPWSLPVQSVTPRSPQRFCKLRCPI
jgi:TetR/AcrR family transcriptional repressor of nem operon